jgi:TP901-1 family phage major tail protein
MAALNGTALVLKVGATNVAKGKSNTFNISRATIDVSNKDSAGWKESIYGQGSGSFDFEGVFEESGTWGWDEAYAAMVAKTVLTVRMATATVGDKYYEASCLITSGSLSAPMEDAVTWSATFEITGAPSTGSVS